MFADDEGLIDPTPFLERFRAGEGLPILGMKQLFEQMPRGEEVQFVRTVYDRFAPGTSPCESPFAKVAPGSPGRV